MLTINTTTSTTIAPLYHRPEWEAKPLPAYLYLSEDGEVWMDSSAERDSVPGDVWHNRTIRWSVTPHLSQAACQELLDDPDVRALLERVHAGHSVEWDGSNMVGVLTEDAVEAGEELQELLDARYTGDVEAQIWDAIDWITADGTRSVTQEWPSSEPLEAAVERIEAAAAADYIHLDGSVREELLAWLASLDEDSLEGEHLQAYEKYILGGRD